MSREILLIDYSRPTTEFSGCLIFNEIRSIFQKIIQINYHIFLAFIRLICYLIYGKGKQVSPITNKILLESVASLAEKIRNGEIKSVEVVQAFIDRINEINPLLNCVVDERFNCALAEARKVDEIIKSKKISVEELAKDKPLFGVPFTTKDSIQIKDMINTAGLWLRKDYHATEDAKSIELLRKAGAIPLALTNVPELCMWWESANKIFGRTRNPYDSSRTVGGSSGGEGCILAAGGSPFGLGSDIGGSIRMPAFFNGIFGHKTSKFVVSNDGQFPPISSDEQDSFLSIGPMCRYASDLKLILKVIADEKAKQLKLDETVDLKNVNFYYQMNDGGGILVQAVEKEIRDSLQKVVVYIHEKLGQRPKRVQFEKFRESVDIWCTNMKDDSGKGSDYQLANMQGKINPYKEMIKYVRGKSKNTLAGLGNAIVERFQTQYGTKEYYQYVEKRNELLDEIQDLLGENGVLLYPTHPTVAPYHWEPYARMFNFSYTAIFNSMGLPATAVPLGLGNDGLPVGIQVIANHNQDRLCFAVAEVLEKAFGGWVAPGKKI